MTAQSAHDFLVASAGVAGTLIGLLFVAISVSPERVLGPDATDAHQVRAAAALTALTNALSVGLFGLIPGFNLAVTICIVAGFGLLFVAGSLLRVGEGLRAKTIRPTDAGFIAGLFAVFILQLITGLGLSWSGPESEGLQTTCILVIVCFLIAISRAWELVGGPNMYLGHQLLKMFFGARESGRREPGPPD